MSSRSDSCCMRAISSALAVSTSADQYRTVMALLLGRRVLVTVGRGLPAGEAHGHLVKERPDACLVVAGTAGVGLGACLRVEHLAERTRAVTRLSQQALGKHERDGRAAADLSCELPRAVGELAVRHAHGDQAGVGGFPPGQHPPGVDEL